MRRFSFRLDRVLSFRESQRWQAAAAVQAIQLRQTALRNEEEAVDRRGAGLREQRSQESDTTGLALRASQAYLDSLTARRRRLVQAQRGEPRRSLTRLMSALLERDRQVKLLERLRARRRAARMGVWRTGSSKSKPASSHLIAGGAPGSEATGTPPSRLYDYRFSRSRADKNERDLCALRAVYAN